VLMEEEFKEKIELPMIEERKNRMLLRPHNKKPTLEELNEHQERYMEMKQNHNRTLTISHGLSVPYRSKFYK
jgi:DNA primase large subunit